MIVAVRATGGGQVTNTSDSDSRGSQKEEGVGSIDNLIDIEKTNEKSYKNLVHNTSVGDQERLNKYRSYEIL